MKTLNEIVDLELKHLRDCNISLSEISRNTGVQKTSLWRLINDINPSKNFEIISKLEAEGYINLIRPIRTK